MSTSLLKKFDDNDDDDDIVAVHTSEDSVVLTPMIPEVDFSL